MQRRQFIKSTLCVVGAGLTSSCASFKASHPDTTAIVLQPTNGRLRLNMTDIPVNQGVAIEAKGQLIGVFQVAPERYVASQMQCSHQGCGIDMSDIGYICPCHGAKFSASGEVLKGPAIAPLKRYPAKIENNQLVIDIK